jgi:phosphatidylglycerophosphate synthase
MFDTSLRRFKDHIGEPIATKLSGISPNSVSLAAFALGMLTAWLAFRGWYAWALTFWLISRFLDGLDGLLARVHRKQSDFGGYLDILLDFVVYAALPIAIVASNPSLDRYLAVTFMLASFYVNGASWMYLAAILEKRGSQFVGDPAAPPTMTTVVMPSGLVGATETILAYCAFLIWPNQALLLFSIFGGLVVFTTLQRLIWAWNKFGQYEYK